MTLHSSTTPAAHCMWVQRYKRDTPIHGTVTQLTSISFPPISSVLPSVRLESSVRRYPEARAILQQNKLHNTSSARSAHAWHSLFRKLYYIEQVLNNILLSFHIFESCHSILNNANTYKIKDITCYISQYLLISYHLLPMSCAVNKRTIQFGVHVNSLSC